MRTAFARKKRSDDKGSGNLRNLVLQSVQNRVTRQPLLGFGKDWWPVHAMEGDSLQTSTLAVFWSVLFKMHKWSWKVVSLIISKLPTHWANRDCENKNCWISQHCLVHKAVKGSLLMSNFSSTGQQWVLNYYTQRSKNGSSLFFLRHQPNGYQHSQKMTKYCRNTDWKKILWHHLNSKLTCFLNTAVQR